MWSTTKCTAMLCEASRGCGTNGKIPMRVGEFQEARDGALCQKLWEALSKIWRGSMYTSAHH